MPLQRCTDEDCGHENYFRSHLSSGTECEECGAPTVEVDVDDEIPAELGTENGDEPKAHPAHARTKAREVLRKLEIEVPPVDVAGVARDSGLAVVEVTNLGEGISGRLKGSTIEVLSSDPLVRKRFTIAHELGHHHLGTRHGDEAVVETEANAFAGELLIPGFMLREAMETTTVLTALASLFEVSRQALEIAAKNHHLRNKWTE